MPRKSSSSRGGRGGSSSSTKKPVDPGSPDELKIVFTNDISNKSKGAPKSDGKNDKEKNVGNKTNHHASSSSNAEGDAAGPSEGQQPRRPDTRKLIGGASWTGKLPVTLLSEHCQKQKWEKPEYTMARDRDGFMSTVILRAKNPKTGDLSVLSPLSVPHPHHHLARCPTAVEARHFAATYTLFRVGSTRNFQMTLPPTYRDLWRGIFQELKLGDVDKGRSWMYADDPFRAQQDQMDMAAAAEKKKAQAVENQQKNTAPPAGFEKSHAYNKKAPKLDMGARMRSQVEALIRRRVIWNPHHILLSARQKEHIIQYLSKLGFRRSHIQEAVSYCKDQEETLEWLLIHVPEDDLPSWTLPEGYKAGVSIARRDLKWEASVKRLAAAGYATELCQTMLDARNGNEIWAAEALQNVLVSGSLHVSGNLKNQGLDESTEPRRLSIAAEDVWEDEQKILEAVYGDRYVSVGSEQCQVTLWNDLSKEKIHALFRKPSSAIYPSSVPVLCLISESSNLPAYVRLAAIKQAVIFAESSLLGEQMISAMVDWLDDHLAGIIEDPGLLLEVAPAAAAACPYRAANRIPHHASKTAQARPLDPFMVAKASIRILNEWQSRQSTAKQQKMVAFRQSLPAWKMKDALVEVVSRHRVTIISGETGSGKSTQSVQFILDDMIQRKLGASANIVCTQPRRISALGLADRVSEERCGIVGREVGFAIRGESKQMRDITRIKFVTTGVLIRQLQTSSAVEANEDDGVIALPDALATVSHIIVDEVHERSLDTDLLLALLKRLLLHAGAHCDLKIILMSATLDANAFVRYFEDVGKVGYVQIEGRMFPVEDCYLEDILRLPQFDHGTGFRPHWGPTMNGGGGRGGGGEGEKSTAPSQTDINTKLDPDLVATAVMAIDAKLGSQEPGGILIFLPGIMEIDRTVQAVRRLPKMHVMPLHASLPPHEQKRVFQDAPRGMRKVIAATNVAETSITIEDIVVVLDSGRVRETSFDPSNNLVNLKEVWASRAACKQRRGRAGRARPGQCFKLFTRQDETIQMKNRPEPEIRRVPLEQLCLSVKAMGIVNVPSFLSTVVSPPESLAIEGAMTMLRRMGALDGEQMTALGRHLAVIPADLRCGKLLVYGATFGCLEACLTIAATLTAGNPFLSSMTRRDEAKRVRNGYGHGHGDLIADLRAYEDWSSSSSLSQREIRGWCEERCMSHRVMVDISANRIQYLASLKESGFIPGNYHHVSSSWSSSSKYNRYHNHDELIRALVAGSFSPQIARIQFPDKKFAASISGAVEIDPDARTIKFFNEDNGRVFVHPSSIIFDAQTFPESAAFMSYFSKMATSKVFIRELTPFNAYTLLLFSSGPIQVDALTRALVVDGWLRLRGWARIGVLVSRLRLLLDDVLAGMIQGDHYVDVDERDDDDDDDDEVVQVVRRLVELNGMDQ